MGSVCVADVDGREGQLRDVVEVLGDLPADLAALGGGGAVGELAGHGGEVGAVGGEGILHRGQALGERAAGLVEQDDVPAELAAHGPDDVALLGVLGIEDGVGELRHHVRALEEPEVAAVGAAAGVVALGLGTGGEGLHARRDVRDGPQVGGRGIGLGLGHVPGGVVGRDGRR